jgi:glycosyltransferase involved in cell wall biosynthesis
MSQTLSVLIPVYNEKKTVEEILRRVRQAPLGLQKEIVVVDDGSTDGTREILRGMKDADLRCFFHEKNGGKTAAIRTALDQARGDFIVIQDADLEYDPNDFGALMGPLIDGRADVVYGSRFLGGPHRVLLFWHYAGNVLFTWLANILYNINLSDMGTCYKAFRAEFAHDLKLKSKGFGLEAEITAKVCKRGLRIYEVPISYSGRTYAEGKKITWKDGFSYLYCLLKYRVLD